MRGAHFDCWTNWGFKGRIHALCPRSIFASRKCLARVGAQAPFFFCKEFIMTFNSPYSRQSYEPEEMSPEDEVIRIGYRTTEEQVREFLTAGVQLAKARGEMYMYASEDEDDEDDMPLSPYADDPVDTFNLLRYQNELKQRRRKDKLEKDSEEKETTALETASQSEAKESAISEQ